MKNFRVKENGISLIALVITIIVLIILTNVLVYNSLDRIYIKKITNLNNDIELLREKTSDFYEQYGKIPAEIKYPKDNLTELKDVLSIKNDIGDFYVIDLEAMQGITLNYGKDYDTIKNDKDNVAKYTDVYIINENSHNIFYVKGVSIEENNVEKKYYTDYTKPDETTVDLRYIDEKLIPENYYYIGEYKDNSGNESIVISNIKDEEVDTTKSNQYVWTKQISKLESLPASITLNEEQIEEFLISVNNNKGYFKNKDGKVIYTKIDEEKWSEIYTKEAKYTDINGDTITIPKGFQVSMSKSMNTVKNGLVIRDKNQNEWVWVEVPSKVFKTATNETEYEKIETDLKEYVKEYRLNSETSEISADWKDEWYDGCGLTKEEYTKTYQTMLLSVYKNKGFWVSRYEIGDETATTNSYSIRTSTSGITGNPVSKRNMIPYNYITCNQAQSLTSKITADTDKTKSLLFGIQWDLICKFIENNSDLKYIDIADDSSSWANTYYSSFTIQKGRYLKSSKTGWLSATETNYTKAEKTAAIITTGSIEKSRALNIYDFAGNMIEWTLEKYKDENVTTGRGGSYSSWKDHGKASDRINSSTWTGLGNSRINFGFRIAMY